ncbi:uroporphyrinogen-III C-methyltransferase [Methyloradius palustris]|uniref:uroporphyrinogen-III C-methyltransferase n=1 Tax=Methyloradius palustris TaxID=2778876 RepID=A0A8D5FY29_9PROT|nr:uroporphyrinogen-III C-methyltransferase [Methyloradius palustris]BCM24137.1 uroporphyrin-III C-methyltransferase [Methyloradius palustris]
MNKGKVYLIGAGPGDTELITIKAVNALALAQVVLIDDLVNRALLAYAPNARVIEVGKRGGCKSTPQHFINRMMIALAEQGQVVARLKGGDPFLFGRGGEEMLALQGAGIAVEIVPGITSGIAVPASIGIPVTHREYTHGVTFVTGHTQDEESPNWSALAATGTTLVIYMGIKHLPEIVSDLLKAGMPANTPVAAIQHGTLPEQQHIVSTLDMLPMAVKQAGLASPAIIVVGDVVRLAKANHQEIETQFAEHLAA